MFLEKFILSSIFLIIFIPSSSTMACHQGDFESTAKGHHKWGKKVGLFQFTENTTVSTATSTSCDYYTAFIETQYEYIEEQIAIGSGHHLDALTIISGCKLNTKSELIRTLRSNYEKLFFVKKDPEILGQKIENLIYSNSLLKMACQKV